MHRIAGHAALLEPGAVDPVQAQIVAAAGAVAAGQMLVCDSQSGALLLVEPDYDLEMDEGEAPAGVADAMPPEVPVGEPPAHAVPPVGWALTDEQDDFEEWEAQVRTEDGSDAGESWGDAQTEGGLTDGEGSVVAGAAASSGVGAFAGAAQMAGESGVRVPRLLPAGMESLPGGAELATALESVQLGEIGAYELVEVVAACARMASAMEALQASAVRELSHRVEMRPAEGVRSGSMTPGRITGLEIGARLMTGEDEAGRLMSRAMLICERLPKTYAMWRSGVLSTEKVDVMVAKLARVDAELAREVEARVLPGAVNRTPASLRRQIGRLLHKLAPEPAKERHRQAKAERFARITPAPDGMAWLEAYLSAEDAAAVKAVLDAGAATLKRQDDAHAAATNDDVTGSGDPATGRDPATSSGSATGGPVGGAPTGAESVAEGTPAEESAGGDGGTGRRTAGNRRADVLAALAWAALSVGRVGGCDCGEHVGGGGGFGLSSARGRPVAVNVTVPLSSLLGEGDEPGELAGFGSVSAAAARWLAAQGTWRRIVTDPFSGAVLDVGRARYTPPRDLADHVLTRDQRCRWPTCDRDAFGSGIQLDHTIAFEDGGGVTTHTNLGPFCDKNHVDKHQAGWTVGQPEPGRFVFTSPTGHVYTTELEPVGPTPDDVPEPESAADPAGVHVASPPF